MTQKTKQENKQALPKLKQCIVYENLLINLLVVSGFKYFYSSDKNKWYLGYYTNTGNWVTLDSSYDEDVIMEKFNTLQKELL